MFITHAHFDHMGNLDQFPNATFYIQERELSKWVWSMSLERRFRWLMLGIDPADIMKAVDLARQGRLVVRRRRSRGRAAGHRSSRRAFDTHTWGSAYVTVRNDLRARTRRTRGCLPAISSTRTKTSAAPIRTTRSTSRRPGHRQPVLADHDHRGDDEARRRRCTHVIPVHEERLRDLFPSRIAKTGLRITELALADGEQSRVR